MTRNRNLGRELYTIVGRLSDFLREGGRSVDRQRGSSECANIANELLALPLSRSSEGESLSRKRDELRLPRHGRKAALAPARLGVFDRFACAGNEVPPDMPVAVHLLSTEQHDARKRG